MPLKKRLKDIVPPAIIRLIGIENIDVTLSDEEYLEAYNSTLMRTIAGISKDKCCPVETLSIAMLYTDNNTEEYIRTLEEIVYPYIVNNI
jgi:hypothetical protein